MTRTAATEAILFALSDLCARDATSPDPPLDQDQPGPESALRSPPWDEVERLAMAEQVAPLLYWAWRARTDLPPAIISRFHQSYLLTALSNELRFQELQPVLRALATADIQTIVLKGAVLASTVYADPALRPMVDVDLLIQRGDVPQALAVFKELGYTVAGTEVHTGARLAYENEIALVKPGRAPGLLPQIMVELHWSLLDSPFHQRTLDIEWFWATAQPVDIGGQPTLMLGVEAELLHLCAHLWLHHRGEGLLWLHDIAAVIYRDHARIDWALLCARAADFHLILPLQQTLPTVAKGWDAPVPTAVLRKLQEMTPSVDEHRIFNWLTAPSRPPAQRFWADLWGQPSWRQGAAFTMRHIFPAPTYMRQRYRRDSVWILPFLYPYRWLLGIVGVFAASSHFAWRKTAKTGKV